MSDVDGPGGSRGDRDGVPFDDSFVHDARYHEPSARERARWVKDARRTKRRNVRARSAARWRVVGHRLVPWEILGAIVLVYWWLGR